MEKLSRFRPDERCIEPLIRPADTLSPRARGVGAAKEPMFNVPNSIAAILRAELE